MRRHNITQLFDAPIFRNIEDKSGYQLYHVHVKSYKLHISTYMTEFSGLIKAYLCGPHNAVTLKYKLCKMCSNLAFFCPIMTFNTFQDVCQTHNYTIEWSCKTRKEIGCPTVQQHNYTTLQYYRVSKCCITYEWLLVRRRYRFYNEGFEISVESVASCLLSCRQLFPRRLLRHFLHRRFKG